MEVFGAIPEGEWGILNGMYIAEEADFTAQWFGESSLLTELCGSSSPAFQYTSWPSHESMATFSGIEESAFCSDAVYPISHSPSHVSLFNDVSSSIFHGSGRGDYYLRDPDPILVTSSGFMSIEVSMSEASGDANQEMIEGNTTRGSLQEMASLQFTRGCERIRPVMSDVKNDNHDSTDSSKKRSQFPDEKSKRNVKLKKSLKLDLPSRNDEEGKTWPNGGSSNTSYSWDDSSSSPELSNGANSILSPEGLTTLSTNSKTRASRGAATNPQSLYARKRRERINERLRILQNLVPNGAKVDISTMLEEAVHYVKFLQLQIKLLSSDDLWMYAPIAYNGMDIGLDMNLDKAPSL